MRFSKLFLKGWRQFESVEIDFHPRLTVITGANGSGKSTLLRIISQHFGWAFPVLATPTYKEGTVHYVSGLFDWLKQRGPQTTVGKFVYSDGKESELIVPDVSGITYNVSIRSPAEIHGLHIGSHRPLPTYQQVGNIPTNVIGAQQAYQLYYQETIHR